MTFYFAWVDPGTAFSAVTHSVQDEDVFAFEISHSEGDVPMLAIDIRNPHVNLIGGGRKLWAWLSMDGTALFYGRLVAIPEDIQNEIVHLNFIAKPPDYEAQKIALAATMKSFPYYDYIWLRQDKLDDPDTVLEARNELWHVDRTSLVLTSSQINVGEDGLIAYTESDIIYESVKISYGSPPLRRVTVKANISWDQVANGFLDFTRDLTSAFSEAGSGRNLITSYTGQGLQSDWPKLNENFNGGWSVGSVTLKRVDGFSRRQRYKDVRCDSAQPVITQTNDTTGPIFSSGPVFGSGLSQASTSAPATARFFIWEFKPYFPITYDVKRRRVETVTFTLEADVQPIVVEPGEDEAEIVTVTTNVVGIPLDPEDTTTAPIGDLRRPSYMKTDRGHNSVEYLLMLARAHLMGRARAVTVEFTVPFAAGIALSCRKNVSILDSRLPDGFAIGKVTGYVLQASGDGTHTCTVTLGCTVGNGNVVVGDSGTPDYVAVGYVNVGYQTYSGFTIAVLSDQITYEDYSAQLIIDDGIDFIGLNTAAVINSFTVVNGESDQEGVLTARFSDIPAAIEALNANFTEVILDLKALVGGPFQTDYDLDTSELMVPLTIQL